MADRDGEYVNSVDVIVYKDNKSNQRMRIYFHSNFGKTSKLGRKMGSTETLIHNYSITPPKVTYGLRAMFSRGGTDIDFDNMTLIEIGFGFVDFEVLNIYL